MIPSILPPSRPATTLPAPPPPSLDALRAAARERLDEAILEVEAEEPVLPASFTAPCADCGAPRGAVQRPPADPGSRPPPEEMTMHTASESTVPPPAPEQSNEPTTEPEQDPCGPGAWAWCPCSRHERQRAAFCKAMRELP